MRPPSLGLLLVGWDRHWASVVEDPDEVVARCVGLAAAVVAVGGQVVSVSHQRLRRGASPASAVVPSLPVDRLPPTTIAVSSSGIDGFFAGELDLTLRTNGIDQLIVAGLGLEGPVHSTLRSANDRGLECVLVTDACAAADADLVAGSLSSVCMSGGIFGAVVGLDAVLKVLAPAVSPSPVPSTQESRP
nr:isochorismatase family protein [Rhabdothermincola salaria]